MFALDAAKNKQRSQNRFLVTPLAIVVKDPWVGTATIVQLTAKKQKKFTAMMFVLIAIIMPSTDN